MNALIEEIFRDFCVDGRRVPVSFLRYEGHNEPYVTYQQTDADTPLSGDDALLAYVAYYDFDVYAKGNYLAIAQAVKDTIDTFAPGGGYAFMGGFVGPMGDPDVARKNAVCFETAQSYCNSFYD